MAATRTVKDIVIRLDPSGDVNRIIIRSDVEVVDSDNPSEVFIQEERLIERYENLTIPEQTAVDGFVLNVNSFLTRKRPIS